MLRLLQRESYDDKAAFDLSEREQAVLDHLVCRARRANREVVVPNAELAQAACLTADQVRRTCRSLDRKGLLTVKENYAQNGARTANAYTLSEAVF